MPSPHVSAVPGEVAEVWTRPIRAYNDVMPRARAKVLRIKAAKTGVVGASASLEEATGERALLGARREAAAAQERVADIEAQIERVKEFTDEVAQAAVTAISDWKDAVKDLAKFAAKEVVGLLVDETFQADLDEAKRQVTQAKARVASIEDANALAAVRAAVANLEEKTTLFSAEQEEMVALAREAEAALGDLVDELSAFGPAGRDAADALEERRDAAETAMDAGELIAKYRDALKEVGDEAEQLSSRYGEYSEIVAAGNRETTGLPDDVRMSLAGRAGTNKEKCARLVQWIPEELGRVDNVATYVARGEVVEQYRPIEDILDRARGRD